MPTLVCQTLPADSLPVPKPGLSPNSPGSLISPHPAAAHHQPEVSVGRGWPRAPSSAGSPWVWDAQRVPRSHFLLSRPQSLHPENARPPPVPLAGAELLAAERDSPRVAAAALTQAGQQEGLAAFLRLGPLFVAGPQQRLEPGPGQRALHLPHGQPRPGAQRARATGEH